MMNVKKMDITYDIVRDLFDYDENNGWLIWKNHPQHKFYNGKRAGSLSKKMVIGQ